MKKPIDHEARTGKFYESRRPRTEDERRAASEKMKDFHRKTGKGTLLGNLRVKRTKQPKPWPLRARA